MAARLVGRRSMVSRRSSVIVGLNVIQQRGITNATKIEYIPDLHSVPRVEKKPGGWYPTLVHSSGKPFQMQRIQVSLHDIMLSGHSLSLKLIHRSRMLEQKLQ